VFALASKRFCTPINLLLLFLLSSVPLECSAELAAPGSDPSPSPFRGIVIGFVGGFVGYNNASHNEVQLANRLSRDYGSNVLVRMFENRRGQEARLEILHLLDTDADGTLSVQEKRGARIAIFGHSWGASEAVTLARRLAQDRIPVLLTVQVDSVQKVGEDDRLIPPNVIQAANFYQLDGILHGRSRIQAADASRTRIVGNFQLSYKRNPVSCEGYPWYARIFMKPHIEIESDALVWQRVESLIRAEIQPIPERN
jgi:hypothetical protein